ncbi:hypothetical protein GG804_02145 [Sphingomonas histidinilytica]|uniref:hypothetical protein n=1 Tax=Rhizorhabdus histidinilytica TaxID=439228 RepID=UPI001ADA1968|nr:hypothetical protein [Rhizorhabdus histidinilytica]MBO9375556.1 hypothetical protein [Rhizorhabdus histidinilytica]
MNDASAANAGTRLFSQIEHDERGNFHYEGDLYRPNEPFPSLCRRIETHLNATCREMRFSVRGETFAHGRKIIAELLDAQDDLADREARTEFVVRIRDQLERFGFTRSNFYQDYMRCSFYADVRIGSAYWAALANRRGRANPVDSLVSLAAFKRRLKPGDQLRLVAAPKGHRALGTTRTVTAVRSGDLIFETKSYLTFPRATGFACDGRFIRIANGNEYDPDEHLLYEWLPASA